MRRVLSVVLATMLAAIMLLPASLAAAADVVASAEQGVVASAEQGVEESSDSAVQVVAAEGGGEEGPAGVEPNFQTTNAPADYQAPFLINAAYLLTGLLLLIVIAMGGLYYLMVQRPRAASGG